MTRVTFSSWRKRIQNGVLITAFLATASGLFCGRGSLVASAPELRTSQKSEAFGAGVFTTNVCSKSGYPCAGPTSTNSICAEGADDRSLCIDGRQEGVCINVWGYGISNCSGTQSVACDKEVLHKCTLKAANWVWTIHATQPQNPASCGSINQCLVP
jgi:hypothetical protein